MGSVGMSRVWYVHYATGQPSVYNRWQWYKRSCVNTSIRVKQSCTKSGTGISEYIQLSSFDPLILPRLWGSSLCVAPIYIAHA